MYGLNGQHMGRATNVLWGFRQRRYCTSSTVSTGMGDRDSRCSTLLQSRHPFVGQQNEYET